MATTEKYTTVIELNSEQAKRNLDELRRKVESWKSDLAEAKEKKMGRSFIAAIRKELREAEKELKKYDSEVARTIDTLNNIGSASVEQIESAQRNLLQLSKEVPKDSERYKVLTGMLEQVTQELENMKAVKAFERLQQEATGATKPMEQLQAELDFIKQTADGAATASVKQLRLAKQTAESIKDESREGTLEWTQASAGLETISKRLGEIDAEQRKMVRTIDRYNQELKLAGQQEQMVLKDTELIDRTLKNISSANIRDMEYSIRILNEQMRDMDRSSDGYKAAEQKVRRLRTELENTRREAGAQQTRLGKLADFFNKNWGVFTQFLGSVTGLTVAIRKSVKDFAAMEEAMADTRKYTGLTDEGVRLLNEDLKKMDTRTPREQLNELAGAAGRLGKTSRQDILDFVDAGNMISVALGDDLGDGAIDKVGKLAMAFGEDKTMGLRGAMLATGSAVNELAQNSSANAGYLVDFTARVAGFAKQIGLTQAQIMGFGAVMDENILQDEMAATAFGNMLTKMQTDTAKFAKIAGMDIKAFTDLLNKDANQAVLTLADSLRSADPQTMMKMLDDMGLDGSRAVAVLATMADKIDDVRQRQELATEAYRQATSIEKEYNTMNNTVEAGIEKAKKQFQEMSVTLGEQLLPVMQYTITSGSLIVRGLSLLTGVVSRNFGTIARLAVLIGAYTAAVKIATNATKIWAVVTKATPWGLAIAGLSGAIALWDRYKTGVQEAREKAEELYRTEAKAIEQYSEEARKIKALDKIVRDETVSIDQRRSALDRLKAIIPSYNGMLDEEGRLTRDNKKAIDDYLVSLEKQIRLKAYKEKLEELYRRQGEQEDAQRKASDDYWNARHANTLQGSRSSGAGKLMDFLGIGEEAGLKRVLDKADQDLADTNGKIESLKKKITEVGDLAEQEAGKAADNGGRKGATSYTSDADQKKAEQERKKREAEDRKRQADEKRTLREQSKQLKAETEQRLADLTLSYSQGLMDYRTYLNNRKTLQLEDIRERMKLYKEGTAERIALENQEKMMLAHGDEEMQRMSLSLLDRIYQLRKTKIEAQYDDEKSDAYHNEWAVSEALFEADIDYLERKKAMYREGSLERMQIEWDIEERSAQHQMELRTRFLEQSERYRQEYFKKSSKEREAEELKAVNDMYDAMKAAGMANEKERQDLLTAISVRYARERANKEVEISSEAQKAIDRAQQSIGQRKEIGGDTLVSTVFNFASSLSEFISTREQLKTQYDQGIIDYQTYMEAMQSVNGQGWSNIRDAAAAALNGVSSILGGASAYAQACSDLEVARITANYDKQIQAAGNNANKRKKLEEKRDKEIKKAKNEANRKAMTIQIAQAIASTAANAISAYGAVLIPGVPWTVPLAVAAAAAATASGMLQIATIKKQQQAQQAGYYEGGFTGGRQYRREAGVVHEGEFVANHQAVQNPSIVPFLNFLDQAQRNNTVGSLTMQDVSRSMGAGGSSQVIAPIVNVHTDNEELREAVEAHREATELLLTRLQQPINAQVVLTGPDGLNAQQERLNKMLNNK